MDGDLGIAAGLTGLEDDEVPLFGATVVAVINGDGDMDVKVQCHGDSYRYQIFGLFEQAKMMIREYEEIE